MRLKKLEILGFKSFADKAALEFVDGITAIVGPNGCGKSNIADAFRWVLGEQSAKSMRGGKMHDVIFAGTSKRAPLNFAEVTITLSEIAGELPVDYDEVAITRRLYRDGESVYMLNKHVVRLKDVQDLLLGSGVGKSAFSIFEQGKIDQIIHYSPTERRCIFEEAAGILRFLQRKRESLRKLEQVDTNLSRLKDIYQEVEKQISVLEKQAERARDYKDKKTLFEYLDKALLLTKWENLQKRQTDGQKKQEQLQEQLQASTETAGQHDVSLGEARIGLAQSEKNLRQKSEEIVKTRGDRELKVREKQTQQERLKELSHKEKRWHAELEELIEKRHHRQNEERTLKKQQQSLEVLLTEQNDLLQKQRTAVHELENSVVEMREEQQAHQQQMMKLIQQESQCESELRQNAFKQESQLDRREHLQDRQSKLTVQIQELSKQASAKKQEMESAAKTVDVQKKTFTELEQKLIEIADAIQEGQQSLQAIIQETADAKARQKVLLKLREEMEGFSAGSKRLLQESSNPKSPLYQHLEGLYKFISPQSGAEACVAAVLRPYAHTLVAKTAESFELVLEFADKHQLKDFSVICLEHLRKADSPSIPKAESIVESVSGDDLAAHFLQHVYEIEDFKKAQQLFQKHPGTAIWSSGNRYLDVHGVLFYASPSENSVFMREAEIKTVEKKLRTLEEQKLQIEQRLRQHHVQRSEYMNERAALDKSIRRDEMTLVEINFGFQRVSAELGNASNEEKQHAAELKTIQTHLEALEIAIQALKQQAQTTKAKISQLQKQHVHLNEGLDQKNSLLKREKSSFQEKEIEYRKATDDHKKLIHSLNILEVKDAESKQQEQRLIEEIESSGSLQSQIILRGTEVDSALEDVEQALAIAIENCKALEQEVSQKKHLIEEIDLQSRNEKKRLKPIEDDLQKLNIQLAQLATSAQSILDELLERYQLTIAAAQALDLKIEKSIEHTERQVRSLRQEVTQSSDVNMTAIEEFEQHKVRHGFLEQQIGDLQTSKDELVAIITQLDSESRKLFKETFEKIRENFKKNFEILFNGGEADLQFTESNDILDAGVEIIAKPPGKQMRSIQLLSGGEKCMTAVALLFAIFEVKPAPFCILDEIDAPLDESNVVRFVNVVKQFIDRCQFIIITHNKRTMTVADTIFGVSMEEKGVSKLLSMAFAKEEEETADTGAGYALSLH